MRKTLIGAAVMALFATGCQNEVLIEKEQVQGELFTLEVNKGMNSRTVLNGNATWWSENDKIYVSGKNGGVTGVLRLVKGANSSNGVFEGYILGGQPSELQHIVFPVPEGGKTINMAAREAGKLDAPMIGTIGDGTVQTLNNVGGLLYFEVTGGEGNQYGVSAEADGDNMTGGYYEFNAEDGTLKYTPMDKPAPVQVLSNGAVCVPVATTTDATSGGGNSKIVVDVNVINLEHDNVISSGNNITVKENRIYGDEDSEKTDLDFITVSDDKVDTKWYNAEGTEFEISDAKQLAGLAKLVNENTENFDGKTIKLTADIDLSDEGWTPVGGVDRKFAGTFDGNGKKISNMVIKETDYAAFIAYAAEKVIIRNLIFEGVQINSTKHAAGVVCIADNGLVLNNIKVTGKIEAVSYAGGLVHNAADVTIKNCVNQAKVSAQRAGGIASWVTSGATIESVENHGNITGAVGASGIAHGFAGTIKNAINYGSINSSNCEPAAGIAGVQKGISSYEYCYNYGKVTTTFDDANSSAAGILGQTSGSAATLNYCVNYGDVTAEQSYAAGIAYSLYGTVTANYCYNQGSVSGADGAGAIAPKAQFGTGDKANCCLNAGVILSSNGKVYQGSNNSTSCYYYDVKVLKNVNDESVATDADALTALNGGTDKEFFFGADGLIVAKKLTKK